MDKSLDAGITVTSVGTEVETTLVKMHTVIKCLRVDLK